MSKGYSKAGTTDGSNTIYYVLSRDLSTAAVVVCLDQLLNSVRISAVASIIMNPPYFVLFYPYPSSELLGCVC